MQKLKNKIIVIAGPTASGKSDIANELAYSIDGEVVSADSMQIYTGLDIGTGKITKSEQKVKHWGLDIINPDQAYSAALYQDYSRKCFQDIDSRNKKVILCGGTGFYIRAAIDDYNFIEGEQVNNKIRDYYSKFQKEHGQDKLWEVLNQKDPSSAKLIHKNNVVRVIRALELYETGFSYAKQVDNLSKINKYYDSVLFGLKVDPEILNKRIEDRVHKMIDNGFIDEVKQLLDKGYLNALTASSAIGYKEIIRYINGQLELDTAINNIIISTRQYAKRQRTWFNKDKRINWIDYNKKDINKAINFITSFYDKAQ